MAQAPNKVLDQKRPHQFVGPRDEQGHLWVVQDGVIMGWSESNVWYESAWWLNPDGTVDHDCGAQPGHLAAIIAERPFDPAWLEVA